MEVHELVKENIPIELKDKIKRITNLPTLPQVACHLLECINDPKTNSSQVASIVSQDMSISAKILRLSNSAFYGLPRTITNIKEAVIILGFKVINTMVLSLTVFDMFPDNNKVLRFNRKQFWKHSLLCGLISKLIAEHVLKKRVNPEDSFCAGLLHDIGKIVMEQYLHEDLHCAIEQSYNNKISLFESEIELLKYSHNDVAEWLLSRWNLPDVIYYPIILHHTPTKIKSYKLNTSICHIADYLSYDKDFKLTEDNPENYNISPQLVQECYDIVGVTDKNTEKIKECIQEEMEKLEMFFEVLK